MSGTGAVPSGDEFAPEKYENVIKSLLNYADYLSEKRIHKLVYLTELKKLAEHGERVTNARFKPKVDGVWSEEISKTLSEMDDIKSEWVLIGGERVAKYNGDGYEADLPEVDREIIRSTCEQYCDLTERELSAKVKETDPYLSTKFGEYIKFESAPVPS